jgi:L-ascorbate metabolism protein UlaG (beta-lactamase superfamily)
VRPRLPLGALVAYLADRRRRDADDLATHAALAWDGGGLPRGLTFEWLGTAGFRLVYQGYTLLIDPYATRLELGAVLAGRRAAPDLAAIARHLPAADAIVVGHGHFDHAMDVPVIAARTGARVVGSPTVGALMRLWGVGDRFVAAEPYRRVELGPFALELVPSAHARLVLGLAVPFAGDALTCDAVEDLTAADHRCGAVYGVHLEVAGTRIYHQGSAELVDDAVVHRDVDIFLCGIAGRGFSERYLARAIGRLRPSLVIPHHHDDFGRPLTRAMAPSFGVDLCRAVDELRELAPGLRVATLTPLAPVGGQV